jgi:hypothetical protein
METGSTLPGVLIDLLEEDGFAVTAAPVARDGQIKTCITVIKDGQEWRIVADNEYLALCELLQQLGWELME